MLFRRPCHLAEAECQRNGQALGGDERFQSYAMQDTGYTRTRLTVYHYDGAAESARCHEVLPHALHDSSFQWPLGAAGAEIM